MIGRRPALALARDDMARFLPWLLALMVYFATLALAVLVVLDMSVRQWQAGGFTAVTVELPPESDPEIVAGAVDALRRTPGVADARLLTRAEMAALLAPWMAAEGLIEVLPLPQLIDVQRRPGAEIDWAELTERLAERAPGATIDTGQHWIERLTRVVRLIQGWALAVVAAIFAVAMLAVGFATRAGFTIHRPTIELLHLLGAEDGYIARQFQRHAMWLALRGGALGAALAAGSLLGLGWLGAEFEAPLFPRLTLAPVGWIGLASVPLGAALTAALTARVIVMRSLSRIP